MKLDIFPLLFNNLKIVGSLVGGVKHIEQMFEFVEKHGIKCLCEHFSFDDFDKALDRLENGKPMFRCVVDTDEFSKKYEQKEQRDHPIYKSCLEKDADAMAWVFTSKDNFEKYPYK